MDERMGFPCGQVAALSQLQKQELNRFLRGIHQDWSNTEVMVEHKGVWESAFERKGK